MLKLTDVIWINGGKADEQHMWELANDPLYGLPDVGLGVVKITAPDGVEHSFIAINTDAEDSGVRKSLEQFIDYVSSNSVYETASIMGDYWPNDVGVGRGYDVYHFVWSNPWCNLLICWMNDDEEDMNR